MRKRNMMRRVMRRAARLVGGSLLATGMIGAQPARPSASCGVDRWPVKTLADRDRAAVRFDVVNTGIDALSALDIPEVPYPADRRLPPHELRVYAVRAIVQQILYESDGDWHLVLKDPASGSTMIAEIPSPECLADPALAARVVAARDALRRVPKRGAVVIAGVGFWDFIHNQRGRARNGFELHPVLSITPLR